MRMTSGRLLIGWARLLYSPREFYTSSAVWSLTSLVASEIVSASSYIDRNEMSVGPCVRRSLGRSDGRADLSRVAQFIGIPPARPPASEMRYCPRCWTRGSRRY